MLQITDKGISIDDFSTIYTRLVERFKQIYGNDVNLDSDTPDGQLLSLIAQELTHIYQAAAFAIQMLDPYQAVGQWLDQRALYAGVVRNKASYSYIDEVIITGTPQTTIPTNTTLLDGNKNKWLITEPTTLNAQGSARVRIRSALVGDFTVKIGDTFTLSAIMLGIDRITAHSRGYGGSDEESDIALLKRFMLSHAINNYDDKSGIKAALYNLTGVTKCEVYENYTHQADDKGVPAHSINVVIVGGADEQIAKVITKKKQGGCGLFGQTTATSDLQGLARVVHFDRPSKKAIAVVMTLGRYQAFSDIDQDAIKANLTALNFAIGETVYASRIISSINLTDGFYIKSLTVNESNMANIGYREYAEINQIEVLIDE
ncbi:putative phage protein gp47/JayE [Orbus hercynius]|uniref:Putative phage protein gp47/JayE n=1 Tax=Orbus hercynius TaxID=593135 RepID=A0A495RHY4_9GAMM|nr:baseplate J/gp47 family protein [Orbus hercynius]RKS86920.1 putative phage protein gp47/JayE [Orbus hercynius]